MMQRAMLIAGMANRWGASLRARRPATIRKRRARSVAPYPRKPKFQMRLT